MTRAVLLDALGTLVELQPPAPRLKRLLHDFGFEVSEERAAAGFMAEIAYYLDHHLDGSDPERGARELATLLLDLVSGKREAPEAQAAGTGEAAGEPR